MGLVFTVYPAVLIDLSVTVLNSLFNTLRLISVNKIHKNIEFAP